MILSKFLLKPVEIDDITIIRSHIAEGANTTVKEILFCMRGQNKIIQQTSYVMFILCLLF